MFYVSLKNIKIPVIFEQDSTLPVFYFRLVFQKSGKAYENGLSGLSSMLARILNEGSDESFFKRIETKAITLSANSGFECFELNLSCLKEHIKFALKELENFISKPRFDEKVLARLKNTTLGELASKNSDFDFLAKRLLNQLCFKEKPFQSSNEGDEKSIEKMSLKELESFFKKHLNVNNLCIVAGGDITQKELESLIIKHLSFLDKGQSEPEKYFKMNASKDEILIKKQSEQAYIYFASEFNTSFKDKNLHLAKLALFILGAGGFGSRLMEEIRVKRGLAYSAYAVLDINRTFVRTFGYLQTQNENAKEAKSIVKTLFKDFVKKGVNESEIEAAKKFLIGSSVLRYESLEKRLNIALSEFYNELGENYFKKELKAIEKVSLNELNHYLKTHTELENLSFASVMNKA